MSLVLSQVSFQYPSQNLFTDHSSLVHQISFGLPPASILHLQGQNGSGKTTLLKLLAGLLRPDEGVITYAGNDIWADISDYQSKIGYLGHKNGIHPNLTVWEQACAIPGISHEHPSLMPYLQDLNLWSLRTQLCATLSAGQKRRLALLRLLLTPAKLWLLDEPLNALDTKGMDFFLSCLQQHLTDNGHIIYTSHHALPWCAPDHQEYDLCNH